MPASQPDASPDLNLASTRRDRNPPANNTIPLPVAVPRPVRRRLFPAGDANAIEQSLREEVESTECNIEERYEILEEISRQPIRPARFLVVSRPVTRSSDLNGEAKAPPSRSNPEKADET
eukprot:TRINITY_DN2000_c0_g1_i1.p1 TRINITY_DN2000_c0_g1~~TRINITY_DN2000_c0_g1_i1.p1  ORF type:complete len:120 (-),score=34.93 TRINITY_DN2000_c0_g1_i1:265-624(-)